MEAVVLAGGFATRLHPLTLNRAKPLLMVAGKPAIEHIFDRLFPLQPRGLSRILVVTCEKFAPDFRKTLKGPYPVPVEIISNGAMTVEDKRGAIGDMALGARHVSAHSPFWVLAGDNLFDFPLGPVVETHTGKPQVVLHSLATPAETREYNNLKLGTEGEILEFVEKPETPWSRRFATCIYLFPPHIKARLEEYLDEGNDPDKAGFFVKWLASREEVRTIEPTGTWFDIGSVEILEQAEAHFAND